MSNEQPKEKPKAKKKSGIGGGTDKKGWKRWKPNPKKAKVSKRH